MYFKKKMSASEDVEEVDIIEAITGRKRKIITFYDENVGRFVKNVAKFCGLPDKAPDFKHFKVVVGGQNINCSRYNVKKMSFFLVQHQPFFVSAIIPIVIFSKMEKKLFYVVGSSLMGLDVIMGNFKFRNGVIFDYRKKSHQIRIVKERWLMKCDYSQEDQGGGTRYRGRGKGSSGRITKSKGGQKNVPLHRDGWGEDQVNMSPGFNFSNTQQNSSGGFNFSPQSNQAMNDMFNQSSVQQDMIDEFNNQSNSGQSQSFVMAQPQQQQQQQHQQQKREKVRFVDVENSRTENFQLSNDNSVPVYRMCDPGINFVGDCSNNKCKAFNQMVVCPMGYGDFDLMVRRVKCPACKSDFDVVNCGFVRSWWKLCGIKTDEKVVNKDWILAGRDGEMSMFVPKELKQKEEVVAANIKKYAVDWKVLKFQVRDPNRCPTGMNNEKLDPDKSFCSICIDPIEKFGNLQVTKCIHFFHKECVQEWVLEQKGKKATCPNCREDMGDVKIDKKIRLKSERHFTKVNVHGYEMFGGSTSKRDILMNYLCTKNHQCTILNGGQKLTYQDWYYCETCGMTEKHGICEQCRKTCHTGHVTCLSKDSPSLFRCCCGNGECGFDCKCLKISDKTTVKKGPMVTGIMLPCGRELLNDALKSGCCTFNVTGRNYISQEAYSCKDCGLEGKYVMCVICKDKCHSGHNVQRNVDSRASFCDCGCGRGRHPCKCMSRENKRKRDDNKTNETKKRKVVK
jgi:hypothetical protein